MATTQKPALKPAPKPVAVAAPKPVAAAPAPAAKPAPAPAPKPAPVAAKPTAVAKPAPAPKPIAAPVAAAPTQAPAQEQAATTEATTEATVPREDKNKGWMKRPHTEFEGNETKFTVAVLTKDEAGNIVAPPAKRPGKKPYERFMKYVDGALLSDILAQEGGPTRADVIWDEQHGYIQLVAQ